MRPLFTTQARRERTLCSVRFVASIFILIGFSGTWVAHRTAALTVTGYELSEFAKFFPQVQGGIVPVRRALFITPLFAAIISLALVVHRSKGRPFFRFGGTILTALLGLAVLPPYQSLLEPAYRLQLIIAAVGLLLTLSTPLTSRFSERVRSMLFLLVALLGVIPAVWQYVLLRPLIGGLYEARILPGWGIIVCVVGFLFLSLASLRDILTS
jgi:hypothetical protein